MVFFLISFPSQSQPRAAQNTHAELANNNFGAAAPELWTQISDSMGRAVSEVSGECRNTHRIFASYPCDLGC